MTAIATDQHVVTLVTVFTVLPDRQRELVQLLAEATTTVTKLPGHGRANIHRSPGGITVVNYAQPPPTPSGQPGTDTPDSKDRKS